MLGLASYVGIELDKTACATHAAAGHATVRADVAAFPVGPLAGKVRGLIASAPCTTFSQAGGQAGNVVLDLLADLIREVFAGKDCREAYADRMARELEDSDWAADMELPKRLARIRAAVASACLVAEPARFIRACDPEWVALEQVREVLPLWQAYCEELTARGYSAWCGLVNAADYGVPQTRVRAILIASRTRRVSRPEPTHYDPRRGAQLWGTPWVSMADALGWGATGRAAPTVTAGGTSTGGAEPFGHRDRDALEREQAEGRWVLQRDRGSGMSERHGSRDARPLDAPAPSITAGTHGSGPRMTWALRLGRGASFLEPGDPRWDRESDQPAPTIRAGNKNGANLSWVLRMDTQSKATLPRPVSEPAPTMQFAHRANLAQWQTATESVRITVQEAAILQSFPADYPWQGAKTKAFEQVGNAVPPLLAMHVLAEATGLSIAERGEDVA